LNLVMRRPSPPQHRPTVNITSLCDVMLSLLIFFMLVSKAGIDVGADPNLRLPSARLGITQEDLRKEKTAGAMLVLNIDPAGIAQNPRVYGKFFASGKEFSLNVTNPTTGEHELRAFVNEVKGGRDEFIVAIHADAGSPFSNIQPVLQAVNTARPSQVRFAFTSPR
jgi:biopolymer transport protein ExbD